MDSLRPHLLLGVTGSGLIQPTKLAPSAPLAGCTVASFNTSCSDSTQNGDDTDVDCGGSCDPCPPTNCHEHYLQDNTATSGVYSIKMPDGSLLDVWCLMPDGFNPARSENARVLAQEFRGRGWTRVYRLYGASRDASWYADPASTGNVPSDSALLKTAVETPSTDGANTPDYKYSDATINAIPGNRFMMATFWNGQVHSQDAHGDLACVWDKTQCTCQSLLVRCRCACPHPAPPPAQPPQPPPPRRNTYSTGYPWFLPNADGHLKKSEGSPLADAGCGHPPQTNDLTTLDTRAFTHGYKPAYGLFGSLPPLAVTSTLRGCHACS